MAEEQREGAEGALTFARIAQLIREPVDGNFDAAHLKEIHRRIFQDLPEHSPGEYRPDAEAHFKARTLENQPRSYVVPFAPRSAVDDGVNKVLSELNGPDGLRNLNAEQFSERMAKLYGDLDYLHPFKEGNSRTLRVFTSQLAREAGVSLDWNTSSADAVHRDQVYIARDKEVLQRAYPGLDKARAMQTQDRLEYEAYALVIERFSNAKSLQDIIKESAYRAQDLAAAKSFTEDSREDALKKHPELAPVYAYVRACEAKAEADALTERQRAVVMTRVRDHAAERIERGDPPSVQVREEREIKAERQGDPER